MKTTNRSVLLERRICQTAGILALAIGIVAQESQADFTYTAFVSRPELSLVGTASEFNGVIRLTRAREGERGAAWFADPQYVTQGFTTSFAFNVTEPNSFGGDGFAFLIQNESATALGAGGRSLGFMDTGDGPGIDNYLAVEFDTYNNGVTFDNNHNHIAVQARPATPPQFRSFLGTATPPFNIENSGVHTAQITYVPGTLSISVDGSPTPLLEVSVDLEGLLASPDGRAWVGFTGSTGGAWQNQDILNWSFSSVPEPTSALLGTGLIVLTMSLRRRLNRRD